MSQEWSVDVDVRHTLPSRRAKEAIFRILEELLAHAAVGSLGRRTLGVSFNVKARDAAGAIDAALPLLHKALTLAGVPEPQEIFRLELETVEEQERRLSQPTLPPFAGITEVAEILGVTRQRAHQLSQTTEFPKPIVTLAAGPVWNRHAIDRFKDTWTRRPGRPRVERVHPLKPPKKAIRTR
jgi:hypothetical protein